MTQSCPVRGKCCVLMTTPSETTDTARGMHQQGRHMQVPQVPEMQIVCVVTCHRMQKLLIPVSCHDVGDDSNRSQHNICADQMGLYEFAQVHTISSKM